MSNFDDPVSYLESIMDVEDFEQISNLDYTEENSKLVFYLTFKTREVASLFKVKVVNSESQTNYKIMTNRYKQNTAIVVKNIRPNPTIRQIRKILDLSVTRMSETTALLRATVPTSYILETTLQSNTDTIISQYPYLLDVQSNTTKITLAHVVKHKMTGEIAYSVKKKYNILKSTGSNSSNSSNSGSGQSINFTLQNSYAITYSTSTIVIGSIGVDVDVYNVDVLDLNFALSGNNLVAEAGLAPDTYTVTVTATHRQDASIIDSTTVIVQIVLSSSMALVYPASNSTLSLIYTEQPQHTLQLVY